MRLRMILAALFIFVLAAGTAMAANIPVTGDNASLQISSESRGSLNFHMEIGSLQSMDVSTKGGDFTRLMIPGFHTSMVEGQPQLPMMNRLISIPVGSNASVNVSNVRTRTIRLADYGITNPVFPVQPSMSKSANPDEVAFVMDRAAYSQSEIRNEVAQVVYQGRLRAMDIGRLEISPVAYFPLTGELEIIESLDVSINFEGTDSGLARDLMANTYSPFFEHLYAGMAGSRGFQDDYPDRVADKVTYVIVTPPMFVGQMSDFVEWKTERGFKVITAVTGTPEVGSTTSEIQSYLHGLYNDATVENPAPSFILFVGDVAQMPTFTEAGDATDRPYCAVDGDLVPDMYYGRFSATNPSELQAQLDKTMMYDQFTMPDPSYLGNVVMIAGVDSGYAPSHGNGQINYGTEHYFNASHGINSNTYLYPESGSSSGLIIGNASDGVGYINYTAHGSQTAWADPSFTQSNINSLTNDGKYFLAVGNCCLTSTYDYGECFGETFLRAESKGAVGYIGGSNSTYWDEDYWWGVGYHPSGEINGSAYPVADTGLGVYDGVFHENGEAEHLWYVTQDAMVFSGNLAVMESGSSRITYYWNIYNLLGDPSVSIYMGIPETNNVGHVETIFMGQTSLNVTAEHGTYVGLTQNGVLVGSGTVDISGILDVEYTEMLTPGQPVHMVAMAQDMEPYITDIMVIVPATVTIDPMVIDVNTATDVTVTVMDAEGTTPQVGINVWAEGLGYSIAPVMTDANGVAVINVNYAFGPTLNIVGQDPADSFRLFTEEIAVNAADLTAPDLTVSTDIGLSDAFALNLPGTLNATVGEGGTTVFAHMPNGTVESGAAPALTVTPGQLGVVIGQIALSGYNIYSESFDVIEAYGTLSGNVTSGGSVMANVIVNGLDEFGGSVFTATTDAAGNYALAEEELVDTYTIVVDHFGYLHHEEEFFLGYGANVLDIDLAPAPSGVLTGTVVDSDTFEGLQGTIYVYRTDNGELYTETNCDENGVFTTSALPYFTYNIRARAYHHVPVSIEMEINQAETIKNFALDPTNGDLLLIDDSGASAVKDVKMGGKHNDVFLADGYVSEYGKSAAQMAEDLTNMGFFVTVVNAADVNVDDFYLSDLVILSCGDNTSTLSNSALKAGLISYVDAGGRVFLEGGELGYNHNSDAEFANKVMHSTDWSADSAGDVAVADASLYILNNPNPACQPMTLTYSGYGDSDAMGPNADAVVAMTWTGSPGDAAVLTYDPNPAPEGGQIVFWSFNYLAVDGARYALMENCIHWLLNEENGNSAVSGQAMMAGESDHSGITITAVPNGGTTTSGIDGSYSLDGLFAGTYTITASKNGWSTSVQEVTLEEGQSLNDVNFVLNVTYEAEVCSAPGLAIPDNDANGVSDSAVMENAGVITAVSAFVDITHTWQGDLIVTLTSPEGTSVVLHDRSGGSTDNIFGWYPGDLAPAGDLNALVGEEMAGEWTLHVSDNAGADTGTLNEWCVHLVYDGGTVAVGSQPMMAEVVAGGTGLSWEYDNNFIDGFNVYRRTAGLAREQLNGDLVSSSSGQINFVDNGEGLSEGQVVFYSYGPVVNGVELGSSNEVEVVFTSGLPTVYALHDNYPNPFNPATTIKFDLPRSGHVKLAIYDIAGRLVNVLVDEVRPAAAHSEMWQGTDRSGRRVSSGTYYYVLQTDSFSKTHKMMLVK
ncbi:MAG: T9SS type A sorting domain-containing protein [bacterium]|nr:T9SS type A sorting domain-containing protein [bacterium]